MQALGIRWSLPSSAALSLQIMPLATPIMANLKTPAPLRSLCSMDNCSMCCLQVCKTCISRSSQRSYESSTTWSTTVHITSSLSPAPLLLHPMDHPMQSAPPNGHLQGLNGQTQPPNGRIPASNGQNQTSNGHRPTSGGQQSSLRGVGSQPVLLQTQSADQPQVQHSHLRQGERPGPDLEQGLEPALSPWQGHGATPAQPRRQTAEEEAGEKVAPGGLGKGAEEKLRGLSRLEEDALEAKVAGPIGQSSSFTKTPSHLAKQALLLAQHMP